MDKVISKRLFHIGPQKTATTWVYDCLKNHPDIAAPNKDHIHYYDIHYAQGSSWYDAQFIVKNSAKNPCFFDPTYSYIRDANIAQKIKHDFKEARFLFGLRHPVERAFSHYWHEKKKGKISHEFADVFDNYDLYADWVMPGLYATKIKPYIDNFGVQNILPIKIADIHMDAEEIFKMICRHARIDENYKPDTLYKIINSKGPQQNIVQKSAYKLGNILTGNCAGQSLFWQKLAGMENMNKIITDELYKKLMDIFMPEIEETEKLFNISLAEWKK